MPGAELLVVIRLASRFGPFSLVSGHVGLSAPRSQQQRVFNEGRGDAFRG